MKKNCLCYYLFLFLSSFSRGIIDIFSLVMLYQKGFSVKDIFLFLFITYLVGIFVCFISIRFCKKYVLIFSNFFYGICFIYLSFMSYSFWQLFLFSILFSFSYYSYHTVRHCYSFYNQDNISGIVMVMYIGSSIASFIGSLLLSYLSFFMIGVILFCLLIISCIPIFFISFDEDKNRRINIRKVRIEKRKIIFSVLEQFKVLFMELQPLFIYLYVQSSYSYIGIFQLIMSIASLFVIYYLSKYIFKCHFIYVSLLFGIVLFFKILIRNSYVLFLLAFLEGIFVKLYEIFSLRNLYDRGKNFVLSYLFVEEFIFLISKSFIMVGCILFDISFSFLLYLFIIFIILSGFFI